MILSFSHEISERRKFGKEIINQEMEVRVDFNPEDGGIEVKEVFIRQYGLPEMEISKLLDKAEGNPLNTIINNIDWSEVYNSQKHSQIEEPEFNMATFANQLLASI